MLIAHATAVRPCQNYDEPERYADQCERSFVRVPVEARITSRVLMTTRRDCGLSRSPANFGRLQPRLIA